MRVIEKDLDHNKVKVRAQTLDDLWHLSHVIELGDIVFAKTFRRVEIERPDKLRPEAFEKRPVYLGIRVKNLEFHKYTNRLRILGTIEAGDESIGAHHTIEVEPRTVLTIEKEQGWKPDQLQRLKEAERAVRVPYVLVVTMDEGEADLAIIRQYGIDQAGKIERSIPGKQAEWKVRAEVKANFYHEVAKAIQNAIDVEKGIKTV
ncbi:MAG: mRNA surveillance protein Pelota, partial [Euryarchaeota archaeon]|nr:mRNA surveillance protein Pelota [Euryarchaeota archaeon]